MEPRLNCYLNSAYSRNIDDVLEPDLHRRLSSSADETETFVDEFPDEPPSCHSEDNQLAAFSRCHMARQWCSLQRLPYYPCTPSSVDSTHHLTSTPKKQLRSMSLTRPPRRRQPIPRRCRPRRSLSVPGRRKNVATFVDNYTHCSKSWLSLRQHLYHHPPYNVVQSTPASPSQYLRTHVDGLPLIMSPISPQPLFVANNSSFSSTRPLMCRNTAVISPTIYSTKKEDSFEEDHSKAFTIAADRSAGSSKYNSWMNMKRQTMPTCTLRSSGFTLLISGTLNCLLCFHVMSIRSRSCELTVSLVSSFINLCLGFTCVWIQQWPWIPHRNYVSGYVVLSLFSILQSATLWILDKHPFMQQDLVDITKGALYGLASLTMAVAVLGVWVSCCCEHPPRDSRVAHGVSGISV